MSEGFTEFRLDPAVSVGAEVSILERTQITGLESGQEERNGKWADTRRRYSFGYNIRRPEVIEPLVAAFEVLRRTYGFRFKDWTDYKSGSIAVDAVTPFDEPLGDGDGAATAFQLVKCYATGLGFYLRPILKPRPGLRIGVDGVEMLNGWRVDFTTGIVTFDAAPASGAALTAGFFYDVPVRFDTESLGVQATGAGALGAPQIDLIEDPRFRSSADEESLLFLDLTNPLAAFVNEDYPGAFTAADPGDPPAAPSNLSATATWTASASFAGTAPGNVADGDDATVWGNNNAVPVTLQAEFGSAATIYVYRLGRVTVTGWTPDTYSPVDWTFEGSDDGTAWTVLDTQTGQALTTDLPPTSYAVESPQAFRFYRLNIGSGGINNWVSLSLVDLIGRV